MAGLHRDMPGYEDGKYLVLRRDGTVPHWPWFVLGARDKAVPMTLRFYAIMAFLFRMDWKYVKGVWRMAGEFKRIRKTLGTGDPDGRPHREDNYLVVALLKRFKDGLDPVSLSEVTGLGIIEQHIVARQVESTRGRSKTAA